MPMSLLQQGSGFPYLARPVYEYLCGCDPSQAAVGVEDVQDYEVVTLANEVK